MNVIDLPGPHARAMRQQEIAQAAKLRVNAAKLRRMASEMDAKAIILEKSKKTGVNLA